MDMVLLETQNLIKQYSQRTVVDKVSIVVNERQIVGLLGRNGAGKTTSFRMIVGMVTPDDGRVIFEGRDITKMPMYQRARYGMGYLSQEPSVFQRLSVRQNLLAILETMSLTRRDRHRRADELIEQFGLQKVHRQQARLLSGGERRKLEIARALVTNPSLILLDEPFSGIDPIAVFEAQQIIQNLKQGGLGILLTDHSVRETLAITDRSYIMYEGKILISGTSKDLISNPKARQIYLGEKFTL